MAFRRTSRRSRSTKRKYRSRSKMSSARGKNTFNKRVKRVIMRTTEGKYKEEAVENLALYHDRGTSSAGVLTTNQGAIIFNPWYNINRGTAVGNRVGDEIYPLGIGIRMIIRNETSRPNLHFRLVVAIIPKIYATVIMDGSNFDLGTGLSGNDILTNFLKKEGVTVLKDQIIRNYTQSTFVSTGAGGGAPSMSSQAYNKFVKIFIRSRTGSKITWKEDGLIAQNPLGVWLVPYENYATFRTDLVANVSFAWRMYYKDC